MTDVTRRVALAAIFVALLAVPWMMRRLGPSSSPSSSEAFGLRFTEQSAVAGLVHHHQAPTLDPQLAHIMPQIASMGAAVSVVDFDRDGWADLYVTNSAADSHNRLFRNKGDGTFEDVAERVGLAALNDDAVGASMGAVWGDYDNDGFEDVFVHRWGRQDLFRNDGGRRFTRVTDASAWPTWANINSAVWFDFDRDGRLDLFLGGYFDERTNLWALSSTRMMPESFEYAQNGGRKYLYRNLGGGRFEEVSESVGLSSRRWALAAVAADLRGTGYPDLVIANDYGVSEYFLNDKGTFREAGRESGIGRAPKSGMNASLGDVFNNGRLSLYVSNITEDGILLQGNNLWVPTGAPGELRYENMATALGIEAGGWSFGAQFGDLNNDGWLDLYLVNGYVSASKDESYWYDFSKVAGGHEVVIGDAAHWPAMGNRSLAGYQQKKVWMNSGSGTFVEAAAATGVTDRYDGRAVVLADLSNRGVLDAVVANQRGPLLYYRNDSASDHAWVSFELEGGCGTGRISEGPCSNRTAIGAQVTVEWNGRTQRQDVSGGAGFSSQNDRRLHFGLGAGVTAIDAVTVRWPSGRTTTFTAPALNRRHRIEEGQ
jgi:hypothetical protein